MAVTCDVASFEQRGSGDKRQVLVDYRSAEQVVRREMPKNSQSKLVWKGLPYPERMCGLELV